MKEDTNIKARDIEERLLNFATEVLNFVKILPRTQENIIFRRQIIRSSSSSGANYAEETCAITKKILPMMLIKLEKR